MKVLVACEFSGRVSDAFSALGHTAVSCDLQDREGHGIHIVGDIQRIQCDFSSFDLMIAHPPCTYLAASGARWWKDRFAEQQYAIAFVRWLWELPIARIAIENPVGRLSTAWRRPDQIVQPWWFGDGETKATCWWLKGLPLLVADKVVDGRSERVHRMPQTKDRWKNRSRTPLGMARAMAEQWGGQLARASDDYLVRHPESDPTCELSHVSDTLRRVVA